MKPDWWCRNFDVYRSMHVAHKIIYLQKIIFWDVKRLLSYSKSVETKFIILVTLKKHFVLSKESISKDYHMRFRFFIFKECKITWFLIWMDIHNNAWFLLVGSVGGISLISFYLFRHVCLAEKLTSYYVWQRTAKTV